MVVASFGYPLVVEPLFNTFSSLPPGELRSSLIALAERDGVAVDDVLVADASRRTTALNAYVSGLGATRRIVVYDTLVEQATPDALDALRPRVRHVVGQPLTVSGQALEVGVSVGSALSVSGYADPQSLLAEADERMYAQKRTPR